MKQKPKSVFKIRFVENWKRESSFVGRNALEGSEMLFRLPVLCAGLFGNTESSLQSGDGQAGGTSWQSQKSFNHVFGL